MRSDTNEHEHGCDNGWVSLHGMFDEHTGSQPCPVCHPRGQAVKGSATYEYRVAVRGVVGGQRRGWWYRMLHGSTWGGAMVDDRRSAVEAARTLAVGRGLENVTVDGIEEADEFGELLRAENLPQG